METNGNLQSLAKPSRRSAITSLLGVAVVLATLGYSFLQLRSLESAKNEKLLEIEQLNQKKQAAETGLEQTQTDLDKAKAKAGALNSFAEEVKKTNSAVA